MKDYDELRREHDTLRRENEILRQENERLKQWVNDLQSGMYVNCVYCGHRYGPDSEVPVSMADILKAHIEQCPEHPMSKLKRKNEDQYQALERAREALEGVCDYCNIPCSECKTKAALVAIERAFGGSEDG
jgi:hypothetical protein